MKPAIIIIDLDGTLCDVSRRVHFVKQDPPEWQGFFDACTDDTPNPALWRCSIWPHSRTLQSYSCQVDQKRTERRPKIGSACTSWATTPRS